MTEAKVLIVDDEQEVRWALNTLVRNLGHLPIEASTGQDLLEVLESKVAVDAVVLDINLPDLSGHEVLGKIRARSDVPVVVLTGYGSIEDAALAFRGGASDYLTKPYKHQALIDALSRALNTNVAVRDSKVKPAKRALTEERLYGEMGEGPEIRGLVAQIKTLATLDFSLIVWGETGTGKELVARALHDLGPQRAGPLQIIDCNAVPESLFEGELFGREKGAFTGANQSMPGMVELADQGTLVLDEIQNLSPLMQSKLLRVVETKQVRRVGGAVSRPVNFRLICVSNRNLREMVEERTFRSDLYFRLAESVIRVPSLRERRHDIAHLVRKFIDEASQKSGLTLSTIPAKAMEEMQTRNWPGNVRELRNEVYSMLIPCKENVSQPPERGFGATSAPAHQSGMCGVCSMCHMPWPPAPGGSVPLKDMARSVCADLERTVISWVLEDSNGNKALAARRLGLDYKTLQKKHSQLGLSRGS